MATTPAHSDAIKMLISAVRHVGNTARNTRSQKKMGNMRNPKTPGT